MTSLTTYLKLYKKQTTQDILLVYHPTSESYWNIRHFYNKDGYNYNIRYNHRSIIDNEIVIEFDDEDPRKNYRHASIVFKRLIADGYYPSIWHSGNKSYHVHVFIKVAGRITALIKSVFMKHYCKGLPLPDLKLANSGHLIRAEFGVHEKTGKTKQPRQVLPEYPRSVYVKDNVWQDYAAEKMYLNNMQAKVLTTDMAEHDAIKYLLDSTNMREQVGDGRERVMWLLINVLKRRMDKPELKHFIKDWYRYANGSKLTPEQIEHKIDYQYTKEYTISVYTVHKICEEVGLDSQSIKRSEDSPEIL